MQKSLQECARLGSRAASDCAQGVFHDFYIAVQGQDETKRPANADQNGQLCRVQRQFQAECWYRTFVNGHFFVPGASEQATPIKKIQLACKPFRGTRKLNCIKGLAIGAIDFPDLVKSCSQLNSREAEACVAGSYMIASTDDQKHWTSTAIRKRSIARSDIIMQCLSMPSERAQEACVYWMGYHSIRSFAGPISRPQARLVCAKLYGRLQRICYRGVEQAQNNDLSPLLDDPTR